jgi:zinc/manganese transport system substrate-binding protein
MLRRLLLAGLAAASLARAEEPLRVVATFSILADMVRRVGRENVAVTELVGPDADPHAYEPRPTDLHAIWAARLLVENGLGLEGWLERLPAAAHFSGVTVVASRQVVPRQVTEGGAAATDPHAWQDPRNGVLYARAIAEGLAQADPARADGYLRAADEYIAEIEATDAWIAQRFAAIPPERRRIITTHDAFGYYGARYGIELLAAEGIGTESEPSARGLAALIAEIRREKVRAVFLENMTDPRLVRMIARETGAVLGGTVYSDALSPPGGPAPSYLMMLRHNTTVFAQAMA